MRSILISHSKSRYARVITGLVGGLVAAVAIAGPATAGSAATGVGRGHHHGGAAAAVPGAGLDTAPDSTPSFNGAVRATAYLGGIVFVGGDFTFAYAGSQAFRRAHLAAMDASTGALLPWHPVADGAVTSIAIAGGAVFVVGAFHQVNGEDQAHLAALTADGGTLVPGFAHAIEGPVFAVAAGNGRLYLGGRILAVDRHERGGAAAFSLADGRLLDDWQPDTDGRIESISVGGGPVGGKLVYLAGKFHSVNRVPGTSYVAALRPAGGDVVRQFRAKMTAIVHAVTVSRDRIYLATGGQGGQGFALAPSGRRLWAFTTDGDIAAIGVLSGTVLFGGHFDNACRSNRRAAHGRCVDGSVARVKIAAVDPATGQMLPWVANANGVTGVLAMTADLSLGKVAVGGEFTAIAGVPRERFAQFSVH